MCEATSSLIDKSVTLRQEIENADDKISEFLSWQDTEQGRKDNLPRIEERHKEILFMEWEQQLMKSERSISRAKGLMNNTTQLINDSLYATNLISDCTPGELPKVKDADSRWKEEINNKNQQISKLQGISWDNMWSYLIKPHSQQMAIKFLSNAIQCIIPEFSDATYTGQLHSKMSQPTEVQDMLNICHLRASTSTDDQ